MTEKKRKKKKEKRKCKELLITPKYVQPGLEISHCFGTFCLRGISQSANHQATMT